MHQHEASNFARSRRAQGHATGAFVTDWLMRIDFSHRCRVVWETGPLPQPIFSGTKRVSGQGGNSAEVEVTGSKSMKIYCPEETTDLPQELVEFARRQIVNVVLYKGDQRRREGRHHMMLPVRAVPVDEHNDPSGAEFKMITRDISATAIGLLHTEPILAQRLALQFSIVGTEVIVVVDVAWSRPLGPFYGAGGRFVTKLVKFPATEQYV